MGEVAIHDAVEVSRWSRGGAETFVLLQQGYNNVGAYGLQVRTWSDAGGARFWWATKYSAGQHTIERAGVALPGLPNGTDDPSVDRAAVLAWLTPERKLAHLKPCTPEQAARLQRLAQTREPTAADLPLINSV